MFEDIETHKKLSKWIIGTFTACILIYLGIRHISHVADAVMWLKDLLNPLLIGLILALFLNVPLGVIERHLFPKHPTSRKTKMRRPLAILLSFILVISSWQSFTKCPLIICCAVLKQKITQTPILQTCV